MRRIVREQQRRPFTLLRSPLERQVDSAEGNRSQILPGRAAQHRLGNDDDRATQNVSEDKDVDFLERFVGGATVRRPTAGGDRWDSKTTDSQR